MRKDFSENVSLSFLLLLFVMLLMIGILVEFIQYWTCSLNFVFDLLCLELGFGGLLLVVGIFRVAALDCIVGIDVGLGLHDGGGVD